MLTNVIDLFICEPPILIVSRPTFSQDLMNKVRENQFMAVLTLFSHALTDIGENMSLSLGYYWIECGFLIKQN